MRSFFLLLLVLQSTLKYFSQKNETSLEIHGGIDLYTGIQLNDISNSQVPIYVSNNQLAGASINLALVEVTYKPRKNIRFQFSPGFGSYMNANYSGEKNYLRWIYEGYVGFKTSKKKDEWLDFGVFSSPYTYEFAKGWEQTFMTRGLAPEYVPYYLLGARYKKKLSPTVQFTLYLLNGWQHIGFQKKIPSLGTQLEYTKDKHYVNWTTYHGNEKSVQQPLFGYRAFTEISWIYTAKKFKLLACGYSGIQEIQSSYKPWGQLNFSAEYSLNKKLFLNGRIEHFIDPYNIQVYESLKPGFNCSGLSLGLKYCLSENLLLRCETKILSDYGNAGYFEKNGQQNQLLPLGFLGIQLKF